MNNLKAKALSFLARREYAYQELLVKLQKYGHNEEEIHQVLQELQQKGWLSEVRYITNYITSKSAKYGLLKIKHELIQTTGNSKLVNELIENLPNDEYATALLLWQKKFGAKGATAKEVARQARFLQSKGFSFAIIKRVLSNTNNEQ